MTKYTDDFYREYLERFKNYTDLDIITAFNHEVGSSGTGTARSGYLAALRHEFNRREIDICSISSDNTISYRRRVSLYIINGKKVVLPID